MLTIFAMLVLLQAPAITAPSAKSTLVSSPDTTEIAVLRAQLAEAKSFRSDMVQTVNTTLATVGGLGLLLVGFSWFTNFRVLEREKVAIQLDLKNALASDQVALRKELNDAASAEAERLRGEVRDATTAGLDAVNRQLIAIQASMKSLDGRISRMTIVREFDKAAAEAWYWQLKEVPSNELRQYQEVLELAMKLEEDNDINESLTNMIRLMEAGTLPSWVFVPTIMGHLDKLPSRYATEKNRLAELLAAVPRN